jgi:zinc protease
MPSRLLPAVLAALLLSSHAAFALDLRASSRHTLDNGLTVLVLEEQSFPLVSVQMLYRTGARDEVPGRTGLAHFVEHMAFRGSEHFPDTGLVSAIYAVGGEWHGYTWIDQTTYFATAPAEQLALLLDIEADRMSRLEISDSDIPAERGAVLAEMHGYENDPSAVLHDAGIFASLLAHPYRNNTIGWESDVRAITSSDVAAFYARHYQPGNAVLAIVGDVDTTTVLGMVRERFAGFEGRAATPLPDTVEPVQRGERRVLLEGPAARAHFQFTWHAPAANSADYPAFLLLQELLGASSGVNFLHNDWGTPVRPDAPLAGISTDIRSWFIPTAQPYVFAIKGSVAADTDRQQIENSVAAAVQSLRDKPVGRQRFALAKERLKDELLLDVQTTEDAAHQLAYFAGIDALDHLLALPGQLDSLRPADIQRVAKRYLALQKRTVAWGIPGVAALPVSSAAVAAPVPKQSDSNSEPAPAAEVLRLDNGIPLILQPSALSPTVHLAVVMPGHWQSADAALELDVPAAGHSAFRRTAPATRLAQLIDDAATAARSAQAVSADAAPASDPYLRMEQLFARQQPAAIHAAPQPALIVAAGQFDRRQLVRALNQHFGTARFKKRFKKDTHNYGGANPGETARNANEDANKDTHNRAHPGETAGFAAAAIAGDVAPAPSSPRLQSEHIPLPLAQTRLGYMVAAPAPDDPSADAWRALLYILSHDYEGRLGKEAISRRGLVYYIDSQYRSNGEQAWITLSAGVDPRKLDALRELLQAELARLRTEPPGRAELAEALAHRLGRARSAAQSNAELADKLARDWLWHGELESADDLRDRLARIDQQDLLDAIPAFTSGTVLQITVESSAK